MKSGRIVERRDQVLIGFLSFVAEAFSTFAARWWSTNGPFLSERVMPSSLLLAARDDHRLRALVAPRAIALGQRVPRRHRRLAFPGAAFAAAVRVIDRVHRDAADRRTNAHPALHPGLAILAQAVLFVRHLPDGRAAVDMDATNLARTQPHLRIGALSRQQRRRGTRRARDLGALAR